MRSYDTRKTITTAAATLTNRTPRLPLGLQLAYTCGEFQSASLDEGTALAFDYLPNQWPMFPASGDERHA
jgi:hypothetical protein